MRPAIAVVFLATLLSIETGTGGASCPPGHVVLAEPNKYGSCCEPKEGLPATP
jgi:hypothetical protein